MNTGWAIVFSIVNIPLHTVGVVLHRGGPPSVFFAFLYGSVVSAFVLGALLVDRYGRR